jgi:hypothetical protein
MKQHPAASAPSQCLAEIDARQNTADRLGPADRTVFGARKPEQRSNGLLVAVCSGMATPGLASGVSRLISAPLYASLAELQLQRLPRQQA